MKKEEQRAKTKTLVKAVKATLNDNGSEFGESHEKTESIMFFANLEDSKDGKDSDYADMTLTGVIQGTRFGIKQALIAASEQPDSPLGEIMKEIVMEQMMDSILKH